MVLKAEGTDGGKSSVWGLWGFTNPWSKKVVSLHLGPLQTVVLFKTSLSLVILNPFTPPCPVGTLVLHLFGNHVLPALILWQRKLWGHCSWLLFLPCLPPASSTTCFISVGCAAIASVGGEELFFLVSQERDCAHAMRQQKERIITWFFFFFFLRLRDLKQEIMDLGSLASAASTD